MKTLTGTMGGYKAEFVDGDYRYELHLSVGIRGFNVPCSVNLSDDGVFSGFAIRGSAPKDLRVLKALRVQSLYTAMKFSD